MGIEKPRSYSFLFSLVIRCYHFSSYVKRGLIHISIPPWLGAFINYFWPFQMGSCLRNCVQGLNFTRPILIMGQPQGLTCSLTCYNSGNHPKFFFYVFPPSTTVPTTHCLLEYSFLGTGSIFGMRYLQVLLLNVRGSRRNFRIGIPLHVVNMLFILLISCRYRVDMDVNVVSIWMSVYCPYGWLSIFCEYPTPLFIEWDSS